MRESDLLSFSAHWKDDVHRAQKQRNGNILRYKDRTYSVATEYQWAATSDPILSVPSVMTGVKAVRRIKVRMIMISTRLTGK